MKNHECATCGSEVEIAIETYCNACRVREDEENLIDDDTCQFCKKPEWIGCSAGSKR